MADATFEATLTPVESQTTTSATQLRGVTVAFAAAARVNSDKQVVGMTETVMQKLADAIDVTGLK